MKKNSIYILSSILVIILSLWTLRFSILNQLLNLTGQHPKQRYLLLNPETELKKFESKIKSDYNNIRNIKVFKRNTNGKSDAGSFLNSMLIWNGVDLNVGKSALRLGVETKDALNASFKDPRIKFNWNKNKLDFSWFKKLHDFDHWNYDLHPPFNRNSKTYTFLNMPSPNFTELLLWSKLRILKGLEDDDINQAFEDIRHLAQLILSTEDYIGTMTSISILESENTFRKSLSRYPKTIIESISEDKIKSAKRFYFTQAGFFDLRLSDEVFNTNKSYNIGLCQRIYLTILNVKAYKKILFNDFALEFERIDKLVAATDSICRKSFARQKWKDPDFQALFGQDENIFEVANQNYGLSTINKTTLSGKTVKDLEKNSTLGKLVMYTLLEISQPDYLSLYRASSSN